MTLHTLNINNPSHLIVTDPSRLVDLDELGLEDESGVGRNGVTGTAGAVAELGFDGELALLADLHAEEALIPTLDDLTLADSEVQRLATVVARIELLAAGEGAFVVDIDVVTRLGLGARAGSENLDLKALDLGESHSGGCV